MVSTRRSSSRLLKKQKTEANVSDDNMEIDGIVVASSSSLSPDVDVKDDTDDDFQAPLPMPTRSLRSKGKGKAKQEPSKPAPSPARRPKLEREASFLRGRIAEIKIENNTRYNKSFSDNNTATSSSNAGSSGTSPTSTDDTEYELDNSAVADSAVASPLLPSAFTEFDSGSQQVSADEDEANLDLVLSNILASRRNSNLHHGTDTEEESEAEIPSSESSSEAEDTSEDDQPLANVVNNNRRRRGIQRQRQPREPYVSFFMQYTKIHAQHVFFLFIFIY